MGPSGQHAPSGVTPLQLQLAASVVHVALAVRSSIARMPMQQRVQKAPSPLKPPPATSAMPDLVGEQVAFEHLQELASRLCTEVRVVVDPTSGRFHALVPATTHSAAAPDASRPHIWAYLDAVDGTLKLSGLGNTPGVARVVNDGSWAVGLAVTEPTHTPLDQLRIGDFSVACILDGSAPLLHTPGAIADAAAAGGAEQQQRRRCRQGATVQEVVGRGGFPPAVVAFRTAAAAQGLAGGGPSGAVADAQVAEVGAAASQEPAAGSQRSQEQPQYKTYAVVLGQQEEQGGGGTREQGGKAVAFEQEGVLFGPALGTTSISQLNQAFVFLDAFQAFDRQTQAPGDEQLACALYARLMNRHEGGAFDVLRSYGNLSSLLRTMLGWGKGDSGAGGGAAAGTPLSEAAATQAAAVGQVVCEPACGAYVVLNENLANLLPCVPVVLGAGGVATDLDGQPLVSRTLAQGRTSVVYAGNEGLHERVMEVVRRCRERA